MPILNTAFAVLDIETSYETVDNRPAISWLSFGRIKVYDLKGNTLDNYVFREWNDLMFIFRKLERKYLPYQLICYCHNLAFEFDFLMKNISRPEKVLSNSTHEIISGKLQDLNIQFRCSYKLSGYSLAKIGDMINLPKLEADYINIYPSDEIPEIYLTYNERDCDIVAKYITEIELKKWGTLKQIPLTKTGKVRQVFNKFYKETENKNCEWDLMLADDCYEAANKAFQGAITISNPLFTNIELLNVSSYDITSSYPYTMLSEQFPYTMKKLSSFSFENLKQPFWIAKIRFNNIISKFSWQWLSISKMDDYERFSSKYFNGKLICADWIERTITSIDYQMICETYLFDSIEIIEFYEMSKYNYLPECYLRTIDYFARPKHELKQKLAQIERGEISVTEQEKIDIERDYALSKNDFNSIYGMSVQKLVQPEFYIDDLFIWHERDFTYRYKPDKHMKRNFLFGVFILAYARRNLLTAIIKNCPETFVYADTDSIKYIGDTPFIDTNKLLPEQYLSVPHLTKLGRFDFEGQYKEFKTLGAKKYAFIKQGSDKVKLTVAGLPRMKEYPINRVDDFKCGVNFENCKLAKAYINNQNIVYAEWESNEIIEVSEKMEIVNEFIEENEIETNGGVVLYPTSYYLDMTNEDKFITKDFQKVLPQFLENHKELIKYLKYGEEIKQNKVD